MILAKVNFMLFLAGSLVIRVDGLINFKMVNSSSHAFFLLLLFYFVLKCIIFFARIYPFESEHMKVYDSNLILLGLMESV